MHNTRAGRVIFPALILVLVGLAFGVVDAVVRKDKVNLHLVEPPTLPPDPGTNSQSNGQGSNSGGQTQAPAPPKPPDELPKGHITLTQAKALFDKKATFVDARKSEVYVEGHVQGSVRLDLAAFGAGDPPLLGMFPAKQAEVVVYCSGGHCDESEQVAKMLNGSGYTAVYVMHDGFPGWKDAGYPVETGQGIQP